jgi:hypothetical protein
MTRSFLRLQENYSVHEQFWERLAGLPREETAQRAKCRYLAEGDSFVVSLLNTDYLVDPARRIIRVTQASDDRPAGYLQQLCILAYLVNAKDLPSADQLVSVEKLDRGGFFFRGSHRLPLEKLATVFGPNPQLLHKVGQALNAMPRSFGDASIELCVLPRIPVTLVVWAGDEEFPAQASIFFDQNAATQLPLDVLLAVATLTIEGVLSTVKTIT